MDKARSYSFDLIYILSSMITQPSLHTLSHTEPTMDVWETNSISHTVVSDASLTSIPLTSYDLSVIGRSEMRIRRPERAGLKY